MIRTLLFAAVLCGMTSFSGLASSSDGTDVVVIKEAATIQSAEGCTINPVYDHADYIDNCDSVFTVTLSAAEAIEANADNDEELEGAQGGLRLVKVDEKTVKLEYLYNDEGDNNTVKWGDKWPDGTKIGMFTLALNAPITVCVEFHYAKGDEDDKSYVKYSIGEDYATRVTSWASAKKVTEVFIANGTMLSQDLLGRFQLGKVVVDVSVELPPGEIKEVDTEEEAKNIVIAVASEIGTKLTKTQITDYKGYFEVNVTKNSSGKYVAEIVMKSEVEKAIENELEKALKTVTNALNEGSVKIAAKPGLYYGVKRGDSLSAMSVKDGLTLATDETVEIKVEKPSNSSSHFYRIICSPTPVEEK